MKTSKYIVIGGQYDCYTYGTAATRCGERRRDTGAARKPRKGGNQNVLLLPELVTAHRRIHLYVLFRDRC